MLRISILTENVAGNIYKAEHGISYLIESPDRNILFDTGHSNTYLENAGLMNIDLCSLIDTIVLSHGHWDHANGMKYLVDLVSKGKCKKGIELFSHPGIFNKRYRSGSDYNIGIDLEVEVVKSLFKWKASSECIRICEGIFFMGQIPRKNEFEAKTTPYVLENKEPDYIFDDTGLVIINGDSIILISGCAHSGICNMMEYAREISGLNKFRLIIGGFHLKKNNYQTKETIKYIQSQDVEHIFPSHCTEFSVMAEMSRYFDIRQLKTGDVIEF